MKLGILLLLISQMASASSYRVGIVNFSPAENGEDVGLAFATDGRIFEVPVSDVESTEQLNAAVELRREVELKLSDFVESEELLERRNTVLGVKLLNEKREDEKEVVVKRQKFNRVGLMSDYISDVPDANRLQNYFYSMRNNAKRKSQCYNRAHVWSWEFRDQYEGGRILQPGKAWLFFTRRYIREYKYKWWFHITPYFTSNGVVKTMDRKYSSGPIDLDVWTGIFMSSANGCEVIDKYTDYENNQRTPYCFVIKTSVHYWQPWQIENAEKKGQFQTSWSNYEVKRAYRNAHGRFSRIPNL